MKEEATQEAAARPPVEILETRTLSLRYSPASAVDNPNGTWLRGAWLLATSTAQPSLLALPFAMASLGWAGGLAVLLSAAAATTYCNLLLARLHEWDGRRHPLYRHLARDIMGARHPYAYLLVLVLQFVVIVGAGIANLILAAQCSQAIYQLYCTEVCPVQNWAWTCAVGALLLLAVQVPDLGHAESFAAVGALFMVTYSLSTVVLAGVQGGGRGASYAIPGSTASRWFNGLNAIGITVFVFTNLIVPEIQATLRADPATGSSWPPMRRAISVAMAVITCLYLLVSVVGYWAHGQSVNAFLLAMYSHPVWLITVLNVMCVLQLVVGEQVFEYVLFEAIEPRLVRWSRRRAPWLHRVRINGEGRRVLVASRACMLLVRTPYVCAITAVAATFPFFSELIGLIGAVGLTPLAFTIPLTLYLMAEGARLSALSYWAHATLVAVLTAAGALAAVGAVRALVVAIQDHEFFS